MRLLVTLYKEKVLSMEQVLAMTSMYNTKE